MVNVMNNIRYAALVPISISYTTIIRAGHSPNNIYLIGM